MALGIMGNTAIPGQHFAAARNLIRKATVSQDKAVTTVDYRTVTISWTGLSPNYSIAFTGTLATLAKTWTTLFSTRRLVMRKQG